MVKCSSCHRRNEARCEWNSCNKMQLMKMFNILNRFLKIILNLHRNMLELYQSRVDLADIGPTLVKFWYVNKRHEIILPDALLLFEASNIEIVINHLTKWKCVFRSSLTICEGNPPMTIDSPRKWPMMQGLDDSLLSTWTCFLTNSQVAGDLRHPGCNLILWRR